MSVSFNFQSPVWAVLVTQILAFAAWHMDLSHKVKFHDGWIQRRIDIAEKVVGLEERMRLAEKEVDQLEVTLGKFRQSH
ncbi:hypothetical protein AGMMS49949_04060 [Alphaproteobacteria bacterium]|nr:hypothetical protein AGMMS49949_04060 [Alphaproteobacteria bacterium]